MRPSSSQPEKDDSGVVRGTWKCPHCGKFCSNVRIWENGLEEIVKIIGTCKTHGEVNLMGCEWGIY
ncbi:hypothetical protein ES703_36818 [subsurface metagenome]